MSELIELCSKDMEKRLAHLEVDLGRVRTGRASVSLLDGIRINYYGTPTPLNQVASLSTPDAKTILISPFEKKSLVDIEKAIQIADIGIQPNNDGSVIRLPVPPLNEERRKEIAKVISKIGEDIKVAIRKVRQDHNQKIKKQEKAKEISDDESKNLQKEIQKLTDKFVEIIDQKIEKRRQEVLKV